MLTAAHTCLKKQERNSFGMLILNSSELLCVLKQMHFETFYGHIAVFTGHGMPPPAAEICFPV